MAFQAVGDLVAEIGGLIGVFNSFPLIVRNASNPQPWQAATANAPATVAAVAAGGTQVLIPAAAGVTVYLHDYSFSQDAANAAAHWQLQDTTGAVIASWFDAAVRHVFAEGDFGGFPVPAGRGVQILNGGANASFLGGFLSYAT